MTFKTVLFDFDGVLSKDRFYVNSQESRLLTEHPETWTFIQSHIFGSSDIPDRWMRNELTMDQVNRYISQQTGINFDRLSEIFRDSVKVMQIHQQLIKLANQLKQRGISIAIVTNNMDVFNEMTVPRLNDTFPVIINSADYGILKQDREGELFDIALERLGNGGDYSNTLLIDDSQSVKATFDAKNGTTYPYTTYENFKPWAMDNLMIE